MKAFTLQHHKNGRTIDGSEKAIPDDVMECLRCLLRGTATEEQEQVAFDAIAQWSLDQRWVRLDCCGSGAPDCYRTLFPVCPEKAHRRPHFRRDSSDDHAPDCDFGPEVQRNMATDRTYTRLECEPLDLGRFLYGHRPVANAVGWRPAHDYGPWDGQILVAPVHQVTLRTLLAGLSHMAQHDQILAPGEFQVQWPEQRIREAARRIVDPGGSGMNLDQLLVIPRHFPPTSAELLDMVAAKAEEHWRGSGNAVAFALMPAQDIVRGGSESRIIGMGARGDSAVVLPHWIRVPVRGDLEGAGPFAVLLKYTWSAIAGWRVATSYAHPVLSDKVWMLVDASGERRTARALYWIREELKSRRIRIEIFKPLFDSFVGDLPIRPDFEILLITPDGARHHLFIETMGSKEKQYLAGKVGPHKRMKSCAELIEDWRLRSMSDADHKAASRLLFDNVLAWVSARLGRRIC